jgi:alpha-ribazole phosphatase
MVPSSITLIRHGATAHSEEKRYSGQNDVSLSPTGIQQIKTLKETLQTKDIHKVYTSTLPRAIQSAKIIFPNHELFQDKQLAELNFGDWDKLTYNEIEHADADNLLKWVKNPWSLAPPKGETMAALEARAAQFLKNINNSESSGNIAIVAHGGSIKAIACHLLNKPLKDTFWTLGIGLASVSHFKFKNKELVEYHLA